MAARICAWLSLALARGSFAGCAKTDTEGVPREQLPAKVAEIFCESIADCCKSSGFAFDSATCNSKIASEYALVLSETSSSNVIYNEQAAGECLAGVRGTLMCGKSGPNGSDAVCNTVFQGKLKAGQVCTSEQECEHPAGGFAFCDAPANASDPKVCVTQAGSAHGAVGQACTGSCAGDIC